MVKNGGFLRVSGQSRREWLVAVRLRGKHDWQATQTEPGREISAAFQNKAGEATNIDMAEQFGCCPETLTRAMKRVIVKP